MKLELVLLTIIVSSITERQVEANRDRVECYEFRNFTGANVTLYATTQYFRYRNKVSVEACKVYGTWVFFSEESFYGKVNVFQGNGDNYYPRERFVIESMSLVPKKSDKSGIFLYKKTLFKYNYNSYFNKETINITGNVPCQSAVVFGPSDWTVESECKGANCKNVQTCFSAPPAGKVSFVTEVLNLGRILSVTPGKCLGNKITGKTKIPECLCNQEGVVDDANKCQGINGICKCKSTHTGYDCGWCKKPLVIQADGTCKAADDCGCDPRGVDNDYSCKPSNSKNGKCNCNRYSQGDKCDKCESSAAFVKRICRHCYCPWNKVNSLEECIDDTAKCNCLKQFGGDFCERCATNYSQFRSLCLDGFQLNQTTLLKSYCDKKDTPNAPSKPDVMVLMKAMKDKGTVDYTPYAYYQLKRNEISAGKAACVAYEAIP